MSESQNQITSLGEVATRFLTNLTTAEREAKQAEVYRFVRWYGWNRSLNELTASEVANYARQAASSTVDLAKKLEPVKNFLTYVHKQGLCKTNLAPHLRLKKASTKEVPLAGKQPRITVSLTTRRYAELKDKLFALKAERPRVAEELLKAAADKDFRENAPLEAARELQGQLEGQIRELEAILEAAILLDDEKRDATRVVTGSKVSLRDLASQEEICYILVDPAEIDPTQGKISIVSPVGKALLGKEKGEIVEITVPAGVVRYRIENIEYCG